MERRADRISIQVRDKKNCFHFTSEIIQNLKQLFALTAFRCKRRSRRKEGVKSRPRFKKISGLSHQSVMKISSLAARMTSHTADMKVSPSTNQWPIWSDLVGAKDSCRLGCKNPFAKIEKDGLRKVEKAFSFGGHK